MINLNHIYLRLLIITIPIFIVSCQQEDMKIEEKTGIQFELLPGTAFNQENGRSEEGESSEKKPGNCSLDKAEYVIVEIIGSGFEGTGSYELSLKKQEEKFKTSLLELTPGDYQVADFIIFDEADNQIFAIPATGSAYRESTPNAIPISFNIENLKTTERELEVLCLENVNPSELGIGIQLKKIMPFHIFASYCDEGHKVAPLKAAVYASEEEETRIWSAESSGNGDLLRLNFPYDPNIDLASQDYWMVLHMRDEKLVGWINLEFIKSINESDSPYLHLNKNCEGDISPFEKEKK